MAPQSDAGEPAAGEDAADDTGGAPSGLPRPSSRRDGWRVTLRAFEHVPFRSLFGSNFLFFNAQFVFLASQLWFIVNHTDSRTLLGMVGFTQGIAMMVIAPFAGVVTDRVPRRHILATSRAFLAVVTLVLALLAALDVIAIWQVIAAALLVGIAQSASQPATQTYVFDIMPPDRVANAVALNAANTGTAQMAGPALGGALIAAVGVAGGYGAAAVFYLLAMLLLFRIPVVGVVEDEARGSFFSEMADGFRVAVDNPVTRWTILLIFTSIAAAGLQTLRPVFAKDIFDVGAFGYGAMAAAFGVGGVCGALLSAYVSARVANKGVLLLTFGTAFYVMEILYGLSPLFATTLVIEVFAGMAAAAWASTAYPLIQMAVPAAVRGRVMSLVFMISTGFFLGQLLAGALADAFGARPTLVLLGSVAVAFHLFAVARGRLVAEAAKLDYA